jgi:multiple sugar transport system permease protein
MKDKFIKIFISSIGKYSVIYFLLALFSILFLFPFIWMISSSVHDLSGVFSIPFEWIPKEPKFSNYPEVFEIIPFGNQLLNTIFITSLNVIFTLFSCTITAYGFARLKFRGRDKLFMLCLSTMMLPSQVTMIPVYVMFAKLGWIDTYFPLIIPSLFGSPFYIFLLRQFFRSIPYELDEAAILEGAGRFRIYWNIILPISKPAVITVIILSFIGSWNDFFGPLIYINSPEKATLTLGLNLLKNQMLGTGATEWQLLMAGSFMVMLPNIVLFFIAQKYFIKGIAMSGLKG